MAIVELEHLEKRYGQRLALRDLSLRLEAGRIGLLGPNGAGKSTLLKIVLGLTAPDRGTCRVLGHDVLREPWAARDRIGYMPEGDAVLPDLTAFEFTRLAGALSGLPRAEATARAHQVLKDVGLGEARYRKLSTYSTGMRQRARLAQALAGDPRLLLLDEPTSGLDPRGREEMLALIEEIPKRTGATVILSTHILPDVEKTCDQVCVIAGGELLYSGPLAPLVRAEEGLYEIECKGGHEDQLTAALSARGCSVSRTFGRLVVKANGQTARDLLGIADGAGLQVRHLAPLTRTLEQAFLSTLESAAQGALEGSAVRS